jgi:hypothetical protein
MRGICGGVKLKARTVLTILSVTLGTLPISQGTPPTSARRSGARPHGGTFNVLSLCAPYFLAIATWFPRLISTWFLPAANAAVAASGNKAGRKLTTFVK